MITFPLSYTWEGLGNQLILIEEKVNNMIEAIILGMVGGLIVWVVFLLFRMDKK